MASIFIKEITTIVDKDLDGFFEILKAIYEIRREEMGKAKLAIDHLLESHPYPPNSVDQWIEEFLAFGNGPRQEMFTLYLRLDINHYLTKNKHPEHQSKLRNKLLLLSKCTNFYNNVRHLGTGLWALDNGDKNLAIFELNSCAKFELVFENPKEIVKIIIESLFMSHHAREALIMSKTFSYQPVESYDNPYGHLLIITKQFSEALKYERIFKDNETYMAILEQFFEACQTHGALKTISLFNLSIDEETMLNEIRSRSLSRPVTPVKRGRVQKLNRERDVDSPARNTRSRNKKK